MQSQELPLCTTAYDPKRKMIKHPVSLGDLPGSAQGVAGDAPQIRPTVLRRRLWGPQVLGATRAMLEPQPVIPEHLNWHQGTHVPGTPLGWP